VHPQVTAVVAGSSSTITALTCGFAIRTGVLRMRTEMP
jgi:hypothetical protein